MNLTKMAHMAQILIVDAGGQYCHLISRRIRESGVQAKICAPENVEEESQGVKGIIISGGPNSVYAPNSPRCSPTIFNRGIPILGICYGHQLMAHSLGGAVEPGRKREYGEAILRIVDDDTILQGVGNAERVWMSHGDEVKAAPPGFRILAKTDACPIAAMADVRH